jgi:hypothetical protein
MEYLHQEIYSVNVHCSNYEGESKVIRNVSTYFAFGYTAGWT